MQYKGKQYIDLLKHTRQVWARINDTALLDFYNAINGSSKYTIAEKVIAKNILLR